MKLELKLVKSAFVLGESVDVDVTLANTGSIPQEVPVLSDVGSWQPTYTLTGPATPEGVTFSQRSVELNDPRPAPEGVVAQVKTLAPGELLEHGFQLNHAGKLAQPGPYGIQARLRWRGLDVVSPKVEFRMDPNVFRQAGIGVDIGGTGTRIIRVAWLGEGPKIRHVGQAIFYEKRPDLGEVVCRNIAALHDLTQSLSEPLMPWANYDRSRGSAFWITGRTSSQIWACSGPGAQPQVLDLADESARLVAPAWQTEAGELKVVFLSRHGKRLSLARFWPAAFESSPRRAGIIANVDLPVAVLEARDCLSSPAAGNECRVIATAEQGSSFVLLHWSVSSNGNASATPRVVPVPHVRALPNSQPAIRVDEHGGSHVAVLVVGEGRNNPVTLLELELAKDPSAEPKVRLNPVGSFDQKITSSSVVFAGAQPGSQKPVWVVMLDNGEIVCSGDRHTPIRPAVRLVQPLQLACSSMNAYALALDNVSGPSLYPLP